MNLERISHFQIVEPLGGGGAAQVFAAIDDGSGAAVALKLLHPDLARSVTAARFRREAAVLGELSHVHIVPVLEWGLAEVVPGLEVPWLTMPLLGPATLRSRLAGTGMLDLDEALRIGEGLLLALEHAHAQSVIHRDVRPDNILLGREGVWLGDFGLARLFSSVGIQSLTSTGVIVGHPEYMSPEQGLGLPLSAASDLYSLGCVLYEMMTGEPVFHGNPAAVAARHQKEVPLSPRVLRPDMPPALEAVLLTLLHKDPQQRPPSATDARIALRAGRGA